MSIMLDCKAVAQLFDDIEDAINREQDQDTKNEYLYDFGQARESIAELFRHRLRAVQQDTAKAQFIRTMDASTAYHTIDWAQKYLPQTFREGQSAYFGKKGMSGLVGSFCFHDATSNFLTWLHNKYALFPGNVLTTRTYILCITRCEQTEQATLSGGKIILQQFHLDQPQIKFFVKRSDNASILGGHATPASEKMIADAVGLTLLTRDYSECQSGKDICDRVSGAAKSRLKAFLHAGNDVMNASDVKKGKGKNDSCERLRTNSVAGMEYCHGIKNLKVATAEILDTTASLCKTRIPEISSIRSIVYEASDRMIIRKASGIGTGLVVQSSQVDVPINMRLVESFESGSTISMTSLANKRRSDRQYQTFFFCPDDSCIESFNDEDTLNSHVSTGAHTTKESRVSSNDTARILLFDK